MKLRFNILLPYAILISVTISAAFLFYGRVIGLFSESKAQNNLYFMERGVEDLSRKIEKLKLNQYAVLTSTKLHQVKKNGNTIFRRSGDRSR